MLSIGVVVLAAVLSLGVMFGTALYGERHPAVLARHWRHVYALSLAVHCPSWSFYCSVTQSARYCWPLPPTFLDAIALYALASGFIVLRVRLVPRHNHTRAGSA